MICEHCSEAFEPVSARQRFCSDRCRLAAWRQNGEHPQRPTCEHCDAPVLRTGGKTCGAPACKLARVGARIRERRIERGWDQPR